MGIVLFEAKGSKVTLCYWYEDVGLGRGRELGYKMSGYHQPHVNELIPLLSYIYFFGLATSWFGGNLTSIDAWLNLAFP